MPKNKMKYTKGLTFDKAEAYLRAKQNIEPDKRNYFSKDWYNKHYGSKVEARRAFARALRVYKEKKKE